MLSLGLSAGSSLLGGIFGGKSSRKAAQQQQDAQQRVIDTTKGAVDTGQAGVTSAVDKAQADYQPYIDAGTGSLNDLRSLASAPAPKFSFNAQDYQQDPGYQFTLQQGQDAIQRAAASKGKLFSGSTLKSLANYTTGTSNQYFNDAFQRANTTFNTNQQAALSRVGTLRDLATLGYSGSAASANAGVQGGEFNAGLGMSGNQTIVNALTNKGNAQAAGTIGGTNSWLSALGQGTNSLTDYLRMKFPSTPSYGGGPAVVRPGDDAQFGG
jgi:hypothetical protein